MKKYLIIINSLYDQYGPQELGDNITFRRMLKSSTQNKIYRAIRKMHLQSPLPFKSIWYGEWKYDIEKYDTVVTADTGNTFAVIKDLKKHYPKLRVINWYRNPVSKAAPIIKDANDYCEVWSFDEKDCIKYGLQYNPQFCTKCSIQPNNDNVARTDAFFIGGDKGRLEQLLNLEKKLQQKGQVTDFKIVGYNSERLTYREVVEGIINTRIIVDIQSAGQDGLTLRPIEALLYEKKLITNNVNIRTYDFYNSNNIFILNEDSDEKFNQFLETPYQKIAASITEEYQIPGWIKKFEGEIEL